jgi:PAS domain S-box-containing protein
VAGIRTRQQLVRRTLRASQILSFVALLFPAFTAVGWIFGIEWLARGHRMLPVMHANTAAGLALGVIAVLLTAERPSMGRRTSITLVLSSAILLLGLLTLGEYAFGWDVGIDRIFGHLAFTVDEPFPDRSSPQTSLNFVLLGAALLSFNIGWPIRLGQIVAILAEANAIAAVTGYIFSAHTFYGFPPYAPTGMSVRTAVSFILLLAALLCRRPTDGMMTLVTSDTNSGTMARRILLAAIVAPPLTGVMTRLGAAAGWYDVSTAGPLFVLVIAALVVRTTWQAARRSEHDELQARAAIQALERTNAELNRASSERQVFAALVENSTDFIGIADATGKPTYVNPAGRRMVGLAQDFPVGDTSMPDYYAPDQRALASEVILQSMVERGHWEGETAFRHWQTDEAIPVSDTHFMIRDPTTGRLTGFGTVTRDISEIKRAREDIERTNRKLAQADVLKTRFYANVSHELRTPLTLILGPAEKHLRTSDLNPDLRRDFEVIERNARTVLRHLNDLLDVARISAGGLTSEYSETDAAAIVRAVADHFSTLASENHIQYMVDTPPALPVQTDLDKLQRILLNLLSNAFKFTPDGGRVRVSLREAGSRLRVEVADSGPGIPMDKREVVFERFAQLEPDDARPRAGTGLGLSIVRDFAALLDGSVSVGDAPEGGALLVVDVPSAAPSGAAVRPTRGQQMLAREIEQLVDELRKRHPAADVDLVAAKQEGGRVLVVEDNRDMSAFIADALRSDRFEVSVAFDGREGFDKTVAERPDLVLTDLTMPGMSGDELVRELRRRPDFSSTPIVVLTAAADEELRIRLLGEGVQDCLNKPFSVAELRARVRNLIARKLAEDHISRLQGQIVAVSVAATDISEAVASVPEDSVRTVLQTIALNARNLTGAEYAAAGIGADPARPFEIWAFVGMSPEQAARIGRPPTPAGLLGFQSSNDRSIRLRDLREHSAHRGFPAHHPDMRSFLAAPIRYRGQVAGNLYLANKRDGAEFTADDQQVVEMLAARAGIALETARLYAAEGRAHAWLQAVVDQMPEGIVLMDAEGRVTVENQALRVITNVRPPMPDRFGNLTTFDLRRPSGEAVAPDDMPIVKAMVDREITWGEEFMGRRIDNRLMPLLVSAAPILTADRRLTGAVMVFQDISVLKELERLREEWASIIAHDLRQPISVIALRSTLLERGYLSDEQRNDVRQIHASTERLNRMTSDLMDASLLETRRLQVTLERLDLSQLLRDVVQRVQPGAPRTKLRLPSDCRLFIKGDAHRLEQVLANLLSNAVKYGAPEADIFLEARHTHGNAEILVTNRGAGIPPDELPLLFERYVRSRAAGTASTRGLGLGLYIARGLVEAHKGRLWAESVPGDVTTFHITIPLDGPPLPAEMPAPDETVASHPELQGTRS